MKSLHYCTFKEIAYPFPSCSVICQCCERKPRQKKILLHGPEALILSWRRSLSYRHQSIGLQSKSMDWFLYDRDLCRERVNFQLVMRRVYIIQLFLYFQNLL